MPTVHALLIGIEDYAQSGGRPLHALPGSIHDVSIMEELLRTRFRQGLQLRKRIASRRHSSPEKLPTLERLRADLASLQEAARAGDQVLLYFSGHGLRLPSQRPKGEGPLFDECLVPVDVSSPVTDSVLRDVELARWMRACVGRGALVTVIIDCCHAGGVSRELETSIMDCQAIHEGLPKSLACRTAWTPELLEGVVFLASCQPHQESHQKLIGNRFQSYMTHCLVQIAKELGEQVTWDRVYRDLVAAVRREMGHQTPHLEGERDRLLFGWEYGVCEFRGSNELGIEECASSWWAEASIPEELVTGIKKRTATIDWLHPASSRDEADFHLDSSAGQYCLLDHRRHVLPFEEPVPEAMVSALEHLARFRWVQYLENPLSTIWRHVALEIQGEKGEHRRLEKWAEDTEPKAYRLNLGMDETRSLLVRNRGNRVLYLSLLGLEKGWTIRQIFPEDSWSLSLEPGQEEIFHIDQVPEIGFLPEEEMLVIFVATESQDLRAFELDRWQHSASSALSRESSDPFLELRELLRRVPWRSRALGEGIFWDWTVERLYISKRKNS